MEYTLAIMLVSKYCMTPFITLTMMCSASCGCLSSLQRKMKMKIVANPHTLTNEPYPKYAGLHSTHFIMCIPSDFLNKFPRTRWIFPKQTPCRSTEPFLRNTQLASLTIANPSDHGRIRFLFSRLLCFLFARSSVCPFSGAATSLLGGLFSQEPVDRVHLHRC